MTGTTVPEPPPARPVTASTVREGTFELRAALGMEVADHALGEDTDLDALLQAHYGITDRLQWAVPLPTLVYRGGEAGGFEWIPWGGVTEFGLGLGGWFGVLLRGTVGAGADLRFWIGPRSSVVTRIAFGSAFHWTAEDPIIGESDRAPTTWRWLAGLAFTDTVGDLVTLAVGIRYSETFVDEGEIPTGAFERWPTVAVGSFPLALRSLPLVQLHVTDTTSLDAHVTAIYSPEGNQARGEYLLGGTFLW